MANSFPIMRQLVTDYGNLLPLVLRIAAALLFAVLIVVNGLYPPFRATLATSGDNLHAFAGYHSVFSGPTPREACEIVWSDCQSEHHVQRSHSSVDWHRFLVQFLTIAGVAVAVGFALVALERRS